MSPYYQDDAVTLYHGDCAEIVPRLTDEIALTLTDPPYGIGVRYGAGSDDSREDYWPWLRERIAEWRAASRVVAFTHRVSALHELHDAWDWVGVWRKPLSTGTRLGNSPILPHWEPVFIYGLHSLGTTRTKFSADVWSYNPVRATDHQGVRGREGWATKDAKEHPVPKPEGLYRDLLRALGQSSGAILDPFAGSGTTLRVAKDAGRRVIGVEIEERFCDLIAKRCAQEVLFPGGRVTAVLPVLTDNQEKET